eukprot:7113479-Alexandrium_andersonii.AAC.1
MPRGRRPACCKSSAAMLRVCPCHARVPGLLFLLPACLPRRTPVLLDTGAKALPAILGGPMGVSRMSAAGFVIRTPTRMSIEMAS